MATLRRKKAEPFSVFQRDPGPWPPILLNWMATLAIIMVFGLVMLFSASYTTGYLRFGDSFHYIKSQLLCTVLGLGMMFLFSYFDHRFLRRMVKLGYVVCLILLVLVLFMLPFFIQQNFGIELPSTLEIIILLFIFAAEILGELKCYFITYHHWDTMLHTTTGFLCAATGFALIDILNRNSRIKFQLSPIYVALAAFCFSMTVGVLWEFFEFGMDRLFHMDMQKDTVVSSITSVMLDPTNSNIPVTIDNITSVQVNGQDLGFGGYLDIGLYDTMKDLFVNFIGAVVFSTIGYFYIKQRGRGKLARAFIPTITDEDTSEQNAPKPEAEKPAGGE